MLVWFMYLFLLYFVSVNFTFLITCEFVRTYYSMAKQHFNNKAFDTNAIIFE